MIVDASDSHLAAGAEGTKAGVRRLRAFVPLAPGQSAREWQIRNSNDDVPDAAPYGLHKLECYGVVPEFSERSFSRPIDLLARVARRASGGLDLVEAISDIRHKRRSQFDVVMCYNERTGFPAILLPSSKSLPVVTGVGWLAERATTPHVLRCAAGMALPRAAAIYAQSSSMLDNLKSDWGVPSERLNLIPFGIDTDFYEVQPPPEVPGVVVSAGVDALRDHTLLIDAMSRVKERNRAAWLELAAGYAAGFKAKAELAPELGCVYTEQMNGRMRDLYRRASVVAVAVVPTIAPSGLTVILEGMASGRPVVASGNPTLREYVIDGVTGILVRPGDADAMANAIAELLDDPERAAEMGRAAAQDVRRRFTSGIMAKHLADIARSVT